jgi:hypothetical protein
MPLLRLQRFFSFSHGWGGRDESFRDGDNACCSCACVVSPRGAVEEKNRNPCRSALLPGSAWTALQWKATRSHALGISGKPDCLIRTGEGFIPVELKNASKPPARCEVYPSHMIQALAHCALVEDQMKIPAPYALVIYAGQQVRRAEFTEHTRRWLLDRNLLLCFTGSPVGGVPRDGEVD